MRKGKKCEHKKRAKGTNLSTDKNRSEIISLNVALTE